MIKNDLLVFLAYVCTTERVRHMHSFPTSGVAALECSFYLCALHHYVQEIPIPNANFTNQTTSFQMFKSIKTFVSLEVLSSWLNFSFICFLF